MLIIEFFGFPGSGKSTITNQIVNILSSKQHNVKILADLRKECKSGFITLCVRNFGLTLRLLFFIILERIRIDIAKLRYIKSILMTINYYTSKNKTDILIMEQGWIQDLISISYEHKLRNSKTLRKLCSELGTLCVPVITDIDINISFSRMIARSKKPGRLDKEKKENQKIIYRSMAHNVELIKGLLPDVISLDSNIDPAINADIIVRIIEF